VNKRAQREKECFWGVKEKLGFVGVGEYNGEVFSALDG